MVIELNKWHILEVGCSSCHPATSVKALTGTQSSDVNQWLVIILSLSNTELLAGGTLLHLCWLCVGRT